MPSEAPATSNGQATAETRSKLPDWSKQPGFLQPRNGDFDDSAQLTWTGQAGGKDTPTGSRQSSARDAEERPFDSGHLARAAKPTNLPHPGKYLGELDRGRVNPDGHKRPGISERGNPPTVPLTAGVGREPPHLMPTSKSLRDRYQNSVPYVVASSVRMTEAVGMPRKPAPLPPKTPPEIRRQYDVLVQAVEDQQQRTPRQEQPPETMVQGDARKRFRQWEERFGSVKTKLLQVSFLDVPPAGKQIATFAPNDPNAAEMTMEDRLITARDNMGLPDFSSDDGELIMHQVFMPDPQFPGTVSHVLGFELRQPVLRYEGVAPQELGFLAEEDNWLFLTVPVVDMDCTPAQSIRIKNPNAPKLRRKAGRKRRPSDPGTPAKEVTFVLYKNGGPDIEFSPKHDYLRSKVDPNSDSFFSVGPLVPYPYFVPFSSLSPNPRCHKVIWWQHLDRMVHSDVKHWSEICRLMASGACGLKILVNDEDWARMETEAAAMRSQLQAKLDAEAKAAEAKTGLEQRMEARLKRKRQQAVEDRVAAWLEATWNTHPEPQQIHKRAWLQPGPSRLRTTMIADGFGNSHEDEGDAEIS